MELPQRGDILTVISGDFSGYEKKYNDKGYVYMCGIAGIVGQLGNDASKQTQTMLSSMLHRGPDQGGLWERSDKQQGVVLGHRRLSILDLSEAGKQPMIHQRTGVALSYNGECYNFNEIRQRLEAVGHSFVSNSDTEVLLAAYVEWGIDSIQQLRGMFAFAIWDPRIQSLFLVRDRMGIKPLYICQRENQLVFASEIRALLAAEIAPRKIDRSAVEAYLWHGFVPGPHTLVKGVELLEAGTCLEVDLHGKVKGKHVYWSLPRADRDSGQTTSRDSVQKVLEDAVRLRLVSDVPLGVFLSGGVDSSVIAALAQKSSSQPVNTFNIKFEEGRYDESPYAQEVASQLGTNHHEVVLTEDMFESHLDDALASLDQPTFDAINTYFISRAVKEAGLTVALSGAGGDELFGGYPSFTEVPRVRRVNSILGWLPARTKTLLARSVAQWVMGRSSETGAQTRWGKLDDVLSASNIVEAYQTAYAMFSRRTINELMIDRKFELHWGLYADRFASIRDQVEGLDNLDAVSQLELLSFVGERLLRDTDAASMATSLEVRVPLLDHKFIEVLAGVSATERFTPLGQKNLLKSIVADQLDTKIFDRPKAGFELPLELWCRRSLTQRMQETLQDLNLIHSVGLDAETVGRLWRSFQKGGAGIYWSRIWSIYILLDWSRRHQLSI